MYNVLVDYEDDKKLNTDTHEWIQAFIYFNENILKDFSPL